MDSTVFFAVLSGGALLAVMAYFTEFPTGEYFYFSRILDRDDIMVKLYETSWKIFEEENYQAASALASLVAASPELEIPALHLAALCEVKLGNLVEAEIILRSAMADNASLSKPGISQYMDQLLILGTLAELYLLQHSDAQAREVLAQTQIISEILRDFHQDPEFRKIVLGPVHHNLGILEERVVNFAAAAAHFTLAAQVWEEFPEFLQRKQICVRAATECAREAAERML